MTKILKHLVFLSVIVLALAFFSACSKSSSKSVSERLIGNWSVLKIASDSNGNGKADANEWQTLQVNTGGFPITINVNVDVRKGGAGMTTYSVVGLFSDSSAFTWSTANGDKDIVVSTSDTTFSLVNGTSKIDSLSDHVLIFRKDTLGSASWIYMTK